MATNIEIEELLKHLVACQTETQRLGLDDTTLYIARAIFSLIEEM